MKTLASVAHGLSDNLITRAADVTLKSAAGSCCWCSETPFNLAHLRNMTASHRDGRRDLSALACRFSYNQPRDRLTSMVDHHGCPRAGSVRARARASRLPGAGLRGAQQARNDWLAGIVRHAAHNSCPLPRLPNHLQSLFRL